MLGVKGNYFLKDEHLFAAEQVEVMATDRIVVYEVLRVVDSVCLFVAEHFNRLTRSAEISGFSLQLDQKLFEERIYRLIEANGFHEGNIKVLVQFGNLQQSTFFYFIPHAYPSAQMYKAGVKADFLKAERKLPQAKTVQENLRKIADHAIDRQQLYDVLLVDANGQVTEGSKTNVFFVGDDGVFTPKAESVLAGITRQKVLECCSQLGLACYETGIPMDSALNFKAAFFTGTSPKILPIAQLGGKYFQPNHPIVLELMKAYDQMIGRYIGDFQK